MNLLLTGILIISAFTFASILVLLWKIHTITNRVREEIINFVSAPDDKTPSPLASFIEAASHTAGHTIAIEVKTTLMGKVSGVTRAVQGEMIDMVDENLQNTNPLLAAISGMMGKRSKGKLLPILAALAGNMKSGNNGNNGSGETYRSPFQK